MNPDGPRFSGQTQTKKGFRIMESARAEAAAEEDAHLSDYLYYSGFYASV